MTRLIIMPTTEPRKLQLERPLPIELSYTEFPSWAQDELELYGQVWAKWFKTDIVMIEEDE